MSTSAVASGAPLGLDRAARERLAERARAAVAPARRGRRPPIGSASSAVDPSLDLSAAVLAARRPGDRFFCFEQPDRGGFALAGLGEAATLEAAGAGRFATLADEA